MHCRHMKVCAMSNQQPTSPLSPFLMSPESLPCTWLENPDQFVRTHCRIDKSLFTRIEKWRSGEKDDLTRRPAENVAAVVAHIVAPPLIVLWHDSGATEESFAKIVDAFVGWGYHATFIKNYLNRLRKCPKSMLLSVCARHINTYLQHCHDDLEREHLVGSLRKLIDEVGQTSGLTGITSAKFEAYLHVLRNPDADIQHLRIYEHLSGLEERCTATAGQLRQTRTLLLIALGVAVFSLLVSLVCVVGYFLEGK